MHAYTYTHHNHMDTQTYMYSYIMHEYIRMYAYTMHDVQNIAGKYDERVLIRGPALAHTLCKTCRPVTDIVDIIEVYDLLPANTRCNTSTIMLQK